MSKRLKKFTERERRSAESFGLRMAQLLPWTIRKRRDEAEVSLARKKKPRARLAALRKLAAYARRLGDNQAAASYELHAGAIQATLPGIRAEERTAAAQRRLEQGRRALRTWQRRLALAKTKIRKLKSRLRRYGEAV